MASINRNWGGACGLVAQHSCRARADLLWFPQALDGSCSLSRLLSLYVCIKKQTLISYTTLLHAVPANTR